MSVLDEQDLLKQIWKRGGKNQSRNSQRKEGDKSVKMYQLFINLKLSLGCISFICVKFHVVEKRKKALNRRNINKNTVLEKGGGS